MCLTVKYCVDAEKCRTNESTRDIFQEGEINYKYFSQVFEYISYSNRKKYFTTFLLIVQSFHDADVPSSKHLELRVDLRSVA